jgi:SAM-dependent methyltransferase
LQPRIFPFLALTEPEGLPIMNTFISKPVYSPQVFEVCNIEEAKRIILTPEKGIDPEERWQRETPFTVSQIIDLLKPEKDSILIDYGCGIGRLAKGLIQQRSCNILAIDTSLTMRQLAPAYVNSPLFSVCTPQLLDSMAARGLSVDAAYSVWVLQHCLNPIEDLLRIKRVLKPGGYFYILNNISRAVPTNTGWVNDKISISDLLNQQFKEVWSSPIPQWLIFDGAPSLTFQKVFQKQ